MSSEDPRDKLQAVFNSDWSNHNRDLPVMYLEACRRWFTALSDSNRRLVSDAVEAFAKGDELKAHRIAAELPPAPVCPLL